MRTKILWFAAAALAASIASSMAQNVYSVNIVGYINKEITGGGKYTLLVNPFDDGNGNQMTNLMALLPKQSQVLIWNNGSSSYTTATKSTSGWSLNFPIPQGTGFFVKNGASTTAGTLTNLFVGSENVSNFVPVPTGYILVGSPLAFAGDLTTDTNINLGVTLLKQSQLIRWDVPSQGYQTVTKSTSGWSGPLSVGVGEGFFIKANFTTNWVQVLK
jgi:hypothetical protein